MIWEQPQWAAPAKLTNRLRRALEEGDDRKRERLAQYEAESRAMEREHMLRQKRLHEWLESNARRPSLSEFLSMADGWVANGGKVVTGSFDFENAWVILHPNTWPPAAYGSASLFFITPNGCRWTAGHHQAITWSGQLVTGLPMTLRVPALPNGAPNRPTARWRQPPQACEHNGGRIEIRKMCSPNPEEVFCDDCKRLIVTDQEWA